MRVLAVVIAAGIILVALGLAAIDHYQTTSNALPPVYPLNAVGAYAGAPITAYAATSGGAGRYMSFETPAGTDYVVPVGKSLVITRLTYTGAAIGDRIVIGYGDDAVPNGAAAPTTPISLIGSAGATPTSSLVVEAPNIVHDIAVYLSIPAGKYPFVQASGTSSSVQFIGVEQ
jgi:hypothetical protein